MDNTTLRLHDALTSRKDAQALLMIVGMVVTLEWTVEQQLSSYALWWEHYVLTPLWKWTKETLRCVLLIFALLETLRVLLICPLFSGKKAGFLFSNLLSCAMLIFIVYAGFVLSNPVSPGWSVAISVDLIFTIGALILLKSRAPLAQDIVNAALDLIDELKKALFQVKDTERGR